MDARRECPTTSALTHFRERSRDSLLIADFCSCSSGSMHVLNTILFGVEVGIWVCGEYALELLFTRRPSTPPAGGNAEQEACDPNLTQPTW